MSRLTAAEYTVERPTIDVDSTVKPRCQPAPHAPPFEYAAHRFGVSPSNSCSACCRTSPARSGGDVSALPDIATARARQADAAAEATTWICETGNSTGWPTQTLRDTQATASYPLTDLAFRLLDPPSLLAASTWEVAADQSRHR